MSDRVRVDVYSRPGCHLCDDAMEIVERVRVRFPFELRKLNLESEPAWEREYGGEIPVVTINGEKAFISSVDEAGFERKVRELWNQ